MVTVGIAMVTVGIAPVTSHVTMDTVGLFSGGKFPNT